MEKRLGWLRNLGSGLLRLGYTIAETFQRVVGIGERTGAEPVDYGALGSLLQEESRIQTREAESDVQGTFDWVETGIGDSPIAEFEPWPQDLIRTRPWESRHQYLAAVKVKGSKGEKWLNLNFDEPPTPTMIREAAEHKLTPNGEWRYIAEVIGEDALPVEFEVWKGVNWETYGWSPGEFL